MKKPLFIAIALLMIITASCTKTEKKTENGAEKTAETADVVETVKPKWEAPANSPLFVKDAVKGAPKNAILGVGTARMSSFSASRTVATTRAHADISRQLNAIITKEGDVTETLSSSTLSGVSVISEDIDDDGNYWVVAMYKQ